MTAEATLDATQAKPYRVLARKYRPREFSELKGQDALVRTLTNAIQLGRVAHAFMLTGVRGVGKTTTARIIARALNCETGPSATPCGVCEMCRSIAEDRNVDVIEMDAASRTGVDDIREIIDSVQYTPSAARYKIFIVDEVHMLSKNAFNALLKTLEEPPAHVKFIFATTEIRKVPITVLSRCQRFDLRRIDRGVLETHFIEILAKEGIEADDAAVNLIARAADGSARDGLSLLDQAIARSDGRISVEQTRIMLGLVDRTQTLDLYRALMSGHSDQAFSVLEVLHAGGADPLLVVQDLLDLTHTLTKLKIAPSPRSDTSTLAEILSVPVLTRTWQILLKGLSEVQIAPNPQQALEMLIIRLLFVTDQPPPGEALKKFKATNIEKSAFVSPTPSGASFAPVSLKSFVDIVDLFGQKREIILQGHLINDAHLVKFEEGHIALRLASHAPQTIAGRVSALLSEWTKRPWIVSLSKEGGETSLGETRQANERLLHEKARSHPIVAEVLRLFPGAALEIKKHG